MLLIGVAHLLVLLAHPAIRPAVTSIFLTAVVIAALHGGLGPGLFATALAVMDLDYTFTEPFNSFSLANEDVVWLIVFVSVAVLTSSLQSGRRRAERSLRQAHAELEERVRQRTLDLFRSREEFSLLVNGVPTHGVFMLDPDGRVVSWNEGAQRLLGYTADAVLGSHFLQLFPMEGSAHWRQPINASTLAESGYEDQRWLECADGSRFWGSVSLTNVPDAAGRSRGYAVSVRDVSERRSLERDIIEISEREQQRIGHDLHDGLGQELSGISLLSTALAEKLDGDGSPRTLEAAEVAELVHGAIGHARDLARGLCPVDLEDAGLASALDRLASRVGRLPGVTCRLESAEYPEVESAIASHLYRIAQEAISNAIRHGNARTLVIHLANVQSTGVRLSVVDDGCGFDPACARGGMGLRLMNYRAKLIRASLLVRSVPGRGTTIDCVLVS